jgi:hypothetical protein
VGKSTRVTELLGEKARREKERDAEQRAAMGEGEPETGETQA